MIGHSPLCVGQDPLPLGLSLPLVWLRAGSRHRSLCLTLGQLGQERVLGLEEECVMMRIILSILMMSPYLGEVARDGHLIEGGAAVAGGQTVLVKDPLQVPEAQTLEVFANERRVLSKLTNERRVLTSMSPPASGSVFCSLRILCLSDFLGCRALTNERRVLREMTHERRVLPGWSLGSQTGPQSL